MKVYIVFFLVPNFTEVLLRQEGRKKHFISPADLLLPNLERLERACTVVYNNNFGLQGKLLWKFGSTERVWKPLKRCICSTGWCARLRICILQLWVYNGQHLAQLLYTETTLCDQQRPSDPSNLTQAHTTLWQGCGVVNNFSQWYTSISVYSLGECTHPYQVPIMPEMAMSEPHPQL